MTHHRARWRSTQRIPQDITPKNRLLMGAPADVSASP